MSIDIGSAVVLEKADFIIFSPSTSIYLVPPLVDIYGFVLVHSGSRASLFCIACLLTPISSAICLIVLLT